MRRRQQSCISEKLTISQWSGLILAQILHFESFLSCFANYDLQGNGINSSSMNESIWMSPHDTDAPLIYTTQDTPTEMKGDAALENAGL